MKKPKNRERRKVAAQGYREDGYLREWQEKNKDKMKIYGKKWRDEKTHKISCQEWDECKEFFDNKCCYCGIDELEHKRKYKTQLHRDHFLDDGTNDITNCVPACGSCNSSKGEKDFYIWYPEREDIYNKTRIIKIESWLSKFQ